MHTDYLNPAMRELRDQQVRFAPREKKIEQVGAGRETPGRDRPESDLHLRISLLSDHQFRPGAYPDVKLTGGRRGTICGCSSRTCRMPPNVPAEAAGERVVTVEELGQAFQCLDEDHFPLAAIGPDQPPIRDGRPQAGRLPGKLGRPVCRPEFRQGPARMRSSAN